jgi:hypothetical protein
MTNLQKGEKVEYNNLITISNKLTMNILAILMKSQIDFRSEYGIFQENTNFGKTAGSNLQNQFKLIFDKIIWFLPFQNVPEIAKTYEH